jgi:hypothetical protein
VEHTGDQSILDEEALFLHSEALPEGEAERYEPSVSSNKSASVFEHCLLAIERSLQRFGEHGLPLMGTGDWNDGMNLVGSEGKGESIWLAWFLYDVLQRFANLYEKHADPSTPEAARAAAQYREQARSYAARIEQAAWDGAWYRRAYYDDGAPLGSRQSDECIIDSIAQSWSVISGAALPGSKDANPQHAQRAMHRTSRSPPAAFTTFAFEYMMLPTTASPSQATRLSSPTKAAVLRSLWASRCSQHPGRYTSQKASLVRCSTSLKSRSSSRRIEMFIIRFPPCQWFAPAPCASSALRIAPWMVYTRRGQRR